jgi:hypothetical protein
MNIQLHYRLLFASLALSLLGGCVSASTTALELEEQERWARNELGKERERTGALLQERTRLEAQLYAKRRRLNDVQRSPSTTTGAEETRLKREIVELEMQLKQLSR